MSALTKASAEPIHPCGIRVGKLQKSVDTRFKCNCCKLVLREPVQGECGHRYCKACVAATGPSGLACLACQDEHEEEVPQLSAATVHPDLAMALELKRTKFHCPWEPQCSVTLPLPELMRHSESECQHRQMACDLCSEMLPASQMEHHQKSKCPKRPVSCKKCGEQVPRDALDRHRSTECIGSTRQCQSCLVRVLDSDEARRSHALKECPVGWANGRPCPYGCGGGSQPLADAQAHRAEALCRHIDLSLAVQEAEQVVEASGAVGLSASEEETAGGASAAAPEPEDTSPAAYLELRLSTAEAAISVAIHGLPHCPTDAGDVKERDAFFDRIGGAFGAARELEREQGNMEQRLRDAYRSMAPLMDKKELEFAELSRASDSYSEALRAMAMKEIRICDVERRITLQEIGSTDGTLVWRIPFFRERLASTDYEPVVISPILFTDRFGYKLNAIAYLNGWNSGRGTHVSIYVRLLKGPFDATKTWPFKQKVTITLVDQTAPTGTGHLSKEYLPDQSSQFQRPSQPQGQPFGFDKFVAKDELESRGFVKDDTAFVKIQVARQSALATPF